MGVLASEQQVGGASEVPVSVLRPADPQFSLRSGVQTASTLKVTSGRHCPVPGTHHYLPGTANAQGGNGSPAHSWGQPRQEHGGRRPGPSDSTDHGCGQRSWMVSETSQGQGHVCAPCDPKHLVSRAVGWRADLQALAPSPSTGVHPSLCPHQDAAGSAASTLFC